MGKGTDLARDTAPEHAQLIDDLKDQLLIVLIKRLGGKVELPITEIDNTGQDTLSMMVSPDRVMTLKVGKKQ